MADKKISALTSASTPLAGTEVLPIVQSGATVKVPISDVTAGRSVSMASATVTAGTADITRPVTSTGPIDVAILRCSNGDGLTGASATYYDSVSSFAGRVWASKTGAGLADMVINAQGDTSRLSVGVDVTALTGNFVVGTSGKGIDFSATSSGSGTMTSELLADYEEGTWTPTDASGAGLTLTQDAQATYTRVGRMVSVQWAVLYPTTASVLDAGLGGLPFTVKADDFHGVSFAQSEYAVPFLGKPNAGGTTISFYTWGNSSFPNSNLSAKRIRGSATYFV